LINKLNDVWNNVVIIERNSLLFNKLFLKIDSSILHELIR